MLTPTGQITKNFSWHEILHSDTAVKYGIVNQPNSKQIDNVIALCVNMLQPLRDKLGNPIRVTSGFRCPELNAHKDIGGAPGSQHTRGEAVDIKVDSMTTQELFEFVISSGIVFDQAIQEYNDWVHLSYTTRRPNRQKAIYAIRTKSGRVRYTSFSKNNKNK